MKTLCPGLKVGMEIKFRAGGKVSRCDGVAGQVMKGIITDIEWTDEKIGRVNTVTIEKSYESITTHGLVGAEEIVAVM